jgi:uncharacterized OB-fold protein
LYYSYNGARVEEPEIIIFVRFGDGGLIHWLKEISPSEVKIGLKVEAVFKPKSIREGNILDIEYFKPAS